MAEGKLEGLVRDGLPVDEELREVHREYLERKKDGKK
jgi:hypothetical protein